MKVETNKPEKCQVKLTVTLETEEARACVKEVERIFVREARIPGFRPGKAPVDLIRKEFAPQLKEETVKTMLRRHYDDAVRQSGIEAVTLAGVEAAECTADAGSFTAMVDVRPKFKLPTYKGLKIAFNDTKVDDTAVAGQIERLRAAYAKYEDAKDGDAVANGDFAQIDYTGTVGGKPILEIASDAKVVAGGTGFWMRVEEGQFLDEIVRALVGMKAGETKTGVKATFSKESAPDPLKGKKALYDITLKAFRRRVLPDDAEFAEKAKAESVEKLTATVREQMERQAIAQEESRRENEALELLMKKVDFDVPQSQVRNAMDGYLNELAQRAQYAGIDASYFEQNRDKILKDAEDVATRQVRVWYVIDAIAAAEKIEAKDDEKGKKVIEFILANAKR